MLRGSGALWDLRKSSPYELYQHIPFPVPQGALGDCFDRYLIRVDELRISNGIIRYCLSSIPSGEIKSTNLKLIPPKNAMRGSMESTIQHFKTISSGVKPPLNELYCATEAPKGE